MKRLILILVIILGSCSEDSMDIPIPPSSTYYVRVWERTQIWRMEYTDTSKTVLLQRLKGRLSFRDIYEKTGVTQQEMEKYRDQYSDGKADRIEVTDQGTHVNYEWEITYYIEINKL